MTHPIPASAHPGVHAEFAARVRRHHTAASLAAAGAEWVPDVSEFNGAVDMGAIKAAGAAGVIIRSSFGTVRPDARWEENRAKADAAGLPWMAYHFAYPAYNTAASEAAFFNRVVGPLPAGRGMAGDFENDPGARPWPLGQAAYSWAVAFQTATGPADYVGPWYCSPSFVAPHDLAACASTWPWWEAEYGVAAPDTLGLAPVMWQETDRGSVAGVSGACDVSIMLRGTFSALLHGGDPVSTADSILSSGTYSGNPLQPEPWVVRNGECGLKDLREQLGAKLDALLSDAGAEQAAIDALTAKAAAGSAVAALATKLDAVLAGLPPDEASAIAADLTNLGKHLGVDVTTGANT